MMTYKIIMFVLGCIAFALAFFHSPIAAKNADLESFKTKVKDCFKDVDFGKQSFVFQGDIIKSANGETNFYSVTEIDKGIKNLDKLLNE